ncbi:MAG: DUF1598 domain-containing protein [Planctomycetales bacterium]|nr:DUF1598 domain-containing protein [Planctomycetales bacterium]
MLLRSLCISRLTRVLPLAVVAAALCLFAAAPAVAQFGGGGGGGGFGGGGGGGGLGGGGGGLGGGGGGTQGTGPFSGVAVDADGVVRRVTGVDPTGRLAAMRAEQAFASLDREVARPSKLRKISLTRLVRLTNEAIAAGNAPDDVMQHLAGLTRIQYVFYYPETQDIVLAGPAEGWFVGPGDRVVGLESGRPVMELQDLAVALRLFGPDAPKSSTNSLVFCSIDPTQEGLARMQQFLSSVGHTFTQINADTEQMIVEGLQDSLGLQTVSVGGVPANTHFAQVMVEADYRMKLIGIGLEQPPVRIQSFVSLASAATIARNALQRWYFVPDYQRIKVTEDGNAAEFVGGGVKLVGEDEAVSAAGGRAGTGRQSGASRRFTKGFTDHYPELAELEPVYGQLRNCIDMLIAAAFMKHQGLFEEAGFSLGAVGDESQYPLESYNAPRQVATAVNAMWKGNRLLTPVGGGVEIRPEAALDPSNLQSDDGKVAKVRDEINLSSLPADQWWWD